MPTIPGSSGGRIVLSAIAAAALLCATAGAASWLSRDAEAADTSAAAASSSSLPAGYGAFLRPAQKADLTASESTGLELLHREIPELQPELAREIGRDGARQYLLVPRTDAQVCLVEAQPSGPVISCTDPARITPALVRYGRAVGAVPDEVRTVDFSLTDGTIVSSAVENNLYWAPSEAESVTYKVGEALQRVDLMPMSSVPPGSVVSPDGSVTIRG
jgi:hypothetical protein